MKRDMDLIRAIVLAVREYEGRPSACEVQTLINDFENEVFGYHIVLLIQSEMMKGVETGPRKDRYGVTSLALTWTGHDFADNILNENVWASAKKSLNDAGFESASFEVWSQMAVAKIKELLDVA